MDTRRREVLAGALGIGLAAAMSEAIAHAPPATNAASAPTDAKPAAPKLSMREKLATAATENRSKLDFDGHTFSGPAWDILLREGQSAYFFLLGEEHGVAQIPALASQLLLALKPSGYQRLAIEISAPVAAELDKAAFRGVEGIRKFIADFPPGPAFYNMKEEAEMLAAVRPKFPASPQMIWGLDYEVIQDRRLIARLKAKAPASAKTAVQALSDASTAAWKQFDATRNPQFIFSFSGDPQLVRDIRTAWENPDAATAQILDVLEGTLETNSFWVKQKGWESNQRRMTLMRRTFVNYWRAEKAQGRAPKTFFKMGVEHMVRGSDMQEVYDIGSLASECATLEGGHSFHVMVVPPTGGMHAQFNPSTMKVDPVPEENLDREGFGFLADLAYKDAFTLIDLRPLRAVLGYDVKTVDPRGVKVIHGFDAMLVLPGSIPSTML
jgi:hypothetical protein